MPCLKRCRCGKEEKYFKFLNDEDIDSFDCDACPEPCDVAPQASPEPELEEESEGEEVPKKESFKSRKARQKAKAE